MYAQNSFYQGGGVGGVSSFSTQQEGQAWDARSGSWVPATALPTTASGNNHPAAYYASAGVSTYQQPPPSWQQPHPSQSAELIRTYTNYYHKWTALVAQQERAVHRCAPNDKPNEESKLEWFKYYTQMCQHAAHWFHQNPNQTTPPFALPPSPQSVLSQQQPQSLQPYHSSPPPPNNNSGPAPRQPLAPTSDASMPPHQRAPPPGIEAPKPQQRPPQDSSVSQSPDGLKRYVDRCLTQCATPQDKAAMMKQIEQAIQHSVQNGTLHSTNWDREPVPSLAGPQAAPTLASASKNGDEISLHDSYFATPLSSTTTKGSSGSSHEAGGQGAALFSPSPLVSSSAPPVRTPIMEASSVSSHSSHHSRSVPSEKFRFQLNNSNNSKKRKFDRAPPLTVSSPSIDYYGPSTTSTNTSSRQPHKSSHGYYGPPSPSSSNGASTSNSYVDSDDFIAVPSANKHRKVERKGSGFNQSSAMLNDRAKRFAGRGGLVDASKDAKSVPGFDRYMGKSTIGGSSVQLNETDYENMKVKGTCLTLEKDYLRLTAPPRAELVRPQPILEQHLANLKAERQRSSSSRRDYTWFCSQLKAVRQDCTVQHLRNTFAVDAYETHARIALEEGDLNEYNQCQTQLKELYRLLEDDPQSVANRNEFVAYRLLYYIFLTGNQKYDGGSSDLFKIMDSLKPEERRDPAVQHALSVRVAVSEFDYHSFFRLRNASPNLGAHLMDRIVPSMRYNALLRMCKAYRPSVEVAFVLSELGFDVAESSSSSSEGLERGRTWLESCGCVLTEEGSTWSTKDTVVRESDLEDKRSLI